MSDTTLPTDHGSESSRPVPHRWMLVIGSAAWVLLADQLTKWWAVEELAPSATSPGRIIDVAWKLRFNYAENTGMAFSQGASSGRWIGLIVVLIVAALVVFAARSHSRLQVILLGVIIGGAIGNLVDRAARAEDGWLSGAVVDFIDLQFWPVFNIADAAVVVGGLLLVLVSLREPESTDAQPDTDGSAGEAAVPGDSPRKRDRDRVEEGHGKKAPPEAGSGSPANTSVGRTEPQG
jgi:signal peptidase II